MRRSPACHPFILAPWVLVFLGACIPAQNPVEGRVSLHDCEWAHIQHNARTGLLWDSDCTELWHLHLRLLLARKRTDEAVKDVRRQLGASGRAGEPLRHLAHAVIWWGLHHQEPEIRLAAVQTARAVEATGLYSDVAALLGDADETVRAWAAVHLATAKAGWSALLASLNAQTPGARVVATRSLGRLAGRKAIPRLEQMTTDPDPIVRSAVCIGLAATKHPRVLRALRRLAEDQHPTVRVDAVIALGSLGVKAGYSAVRGALFDPDPGVRSAAVASLARFSSQRSKRDLAAITRGDDLALRLHAAVALARLGQVQPVLNAIATGLRHKKAQQRIAALQAAGAVQDRVALAFARRGLGDTQPEVRLAAAKAVLAHADRAAAARAALVLRRQACESARWGMEKICLQALDLLVQAQHRQGLPAMIDLARRAPSYTTRLLAWRVVLERQFSANLALDAMLDPSAHVRLAVAADILRSLSSPPAARLLPKHR